MKSCIYLSSSQERPNQRKKKAIFYFLNCSEFPTSLCHNIVPFFSIFFVMLTKTRPFSGPSLVSQREIFHEKLYLSLLITGKAKTNKEKGKLLFSQLFRISYITLSQHCTILFYIFRHVKKTRPFSGPSLVSQREIFHEKL